MPALVVATPLQVGAEVEAGAPVLVLEAMKMETVLRAPFRARLKESSVAVGTQVEAGAPLLRLEPIAEEGTEAAAARPDRRSSWTCPRRPPTAGAVPGRTRPGGPVRAASRLRRGPARRAAGARRLPGRAPGGRRGRAPAAGRGTGTGERLRRPGRAEP
ncbi:acetyl-CoA carboxylase biotin carboxyl carrier protein subunit [Micromonospora sp. BRA006-A]|nr:acetyl-CoA carboxylase biotin carboxyl carrier protein subunit [Micromonospora sp. BRA006-A]